MALWSIYLALTLVGLGLPNPDLGTNPHLLPRLLATLGGTLLLAGVNLFASSWTMDRIRRRPAGITALLRRYALWCRMELIVRSLFFILLVTLIGFNTIVRETWGLEQGLVVDDLLILVPFLVLLIIDARCRQQVDFAVDRATRPSWLPAVSWPDPADALSVRLRTEHAPWLAMILFVSLLHDVILRWDLDQPTNQVGSFLIIAGLFAGGILLLPWILRMILVVEPLPSGAIRNALDRWAADERVRVAEIFVWRTPASVVNAAVAGLVAPIRYVFLTETLISQFSGLGIAACGDWLDRSVLGPAVDVGQLPPWLASAPAGLVMAFPYFWFTLGWFSRQFELQADLDGCRAASAAVLQSWEKIGDEPHAEGVRLFRRSLERVALMNGSNPKRWSWRHGRLTDRLAHLDRIERNPSLTPIFHRRLARVMLTAWALPALIAFAFLVAP
jgi:Zn-dependent protease with chaperone function